MIPFNLKGLIPVVAGSILFISILLTHLYIKNLKLHLTQEKLYNKELSIQIQNQNKAVDELKKESDGYEIKLKEANKKSKIILSAYNEKLQKIEKEELKDGCEGAMEYGIKKAKEL